MVRRTLLVALALGVALWLLSSERAEAKHKFKLKKTHGDACEAYAGNDTGPTDCGGCGGCGSAPSCCKPKCRPARCHKAKCCDPCADACPPPCARPRSCKPACPKPACNPCGDCCDSCSRPRPLHDFFHALRSCCEDLCGCGGESSCGCGEPAPACGCGH